MRFFAFALIALIAISCVSAQSQADLDKFKDYMDCIKKVKEPCQTTDKDCLAEQDKIEECSQKCKDDNASSQSDALSCVKKCTSTNKDVQTWYDATIACLSSSMTSFVLTFAIAIFALLF
ncbi:transmembrane protein, putative (macronuclear) [Tetrahymena thermophila SB210]|uniref:Transmembrane protein, putative n=1 Tax=Tetrahymena thermophila (strain SB210) TaxID=312017 RepID=Q23UI8_TETTS|nr:transmembrane protein, putative [Tetrahymena thermophila SB210]EAS00170.1 transmembrane protein, putative [Tetrahymena thermophila SB210]|eukprot:XP_001020415.1 transmembrane protein, putative [Tetrahymena thermophila SB210]